MNFKRLMRVKDATNNKPWKNSVLTQEDIDTLLQMNDSEKSEYIREFKKTHPLRPDSAWKDASLYMAPFLIDHLLDSRDTGQTIQQKYEKFLEDSSWVDDSLVIEYADIFEEALGVDRASVYKAWRSNRNVWRDDRKPVRTRTIKPAAGSKVKITYFDNESAASRGMEAGSSLTKSFSSIDKAADWMYNQGIYFDGTEDGEPAPGLTVDDLIEAANTVDISSGEIIIFSISTNGEVHKTDWSPEDFV